MPFEAVFNLLTSCSDNVPLPPGVSAAVSQDIDCSREDFPRTCHFAPGRKEVEPRKSRMPRWSNWNSTDTWELCIPKNQTSAALILPRGSFVVQLRAKGMALVEDRLRKYGHQLLQSAGQEGLYIITGTETCTTWANGVWLPNKEFFAKFHTAKWRWSGKANGDGKEKKHPRTKDEERDAKSENQVVFLHGFWIDVFESLGGPVLQHSAYPTDIGNRSTVSGGGAGTVRYSSSHPPNILSGSGAPSSSTPYVGNGITRTTTRDPTGVVQVKVNFNLDFIGFRHPCELINKLGLIFVSSLYLANSDRLFFSHDHHWMSILYESDDHFPGNDELCERICSKYKFVLENNTVCPIELSETPDIPLLQRTTVQLICPHDLLTAVVELRGEWPPLDTPVTHGHRLHFSAGTNDSGELDELYAYLHHSGLHSIIPTEVPIPIAFDFAFVPAVLKPVTKRP
ncbi:hypothetical protein L218DRAFT_1005669 [Marasmius fiardii PR-910]|nr:hypothetical protein L218DRAFT_1005669 [Marasmius fiardii PR-910]